MTSHSHSHTHTDEALTGGWEHWLGSTRLRLVLAALGLSFIAAIGAMVVLWPTGVGQADATAAADQIGLATERVGAIVVTSDDAECSYSTPEAPQRCRLLTLDITEGPDAGAVIALPEINLQIERSVPELSPGDAVILGRIPSTNSYFFEDLERSNVLVVLAVVFAVIVIGFGRMRGALALVAMAATLAILVGFVAPSVLDGNDPVLVALVAATVIAFVALFLTHGFTPTTTVALAGTLSALAVTFVLSWIFFDLARFTGFGSSEALVLPFLDVDLRVSSLLLGGAVIGALGALDDVTVTQVSIVAELRRHNPVMPAAELVHSGVRIGRDHIAATVNTLLLAYAGASLPLLLLFAAFDQPLSKVASSEVIAVEIVRTLCGSIGLIAAVPLTTALAAAVLPARADDSHRAHDLGEVGDVGAAAEALDRAPSWDDFAPE